jgi:hypothetical protein
MDPDDLEREYPVGRNFTFYYDPDDPGTAVIDNSMSIVPIILLFVSIVVTILGAFVGVYPEAVVDLLPKGETIPGTEGSF